VRKLWGNGSVRACVCGVCVRVMVVCKVCSARWGVRSAVARPAEPGRRQRTPAMLCRVPTPCGGKGGGGGGGGGGVGRAGGGGHGVVVPMQGCGGWGRCVSGRTFLQICGGGKGTVRTSFEQWAEWYNGRRHQIFRPARDSSNCRRRGRRWGVAGVACVRQPATGYAALYRKAGVGLQRSNATCVGRMR